MKEAPTAMTAGEGPDGEPLVYVFYGSLVRRILQDDDGRPIEEWCNKGNRYRYPFKDAPAPYTTLWPKLVGTLGKDGPSGVFSRDEQDPRLDYTFHAVMSADGTYRKVSWNHLDGMQKPKLSDVPPLPAGFTVTACCEFPDAGLVLLFGTGGGKSGYCAWNPVDATVDAKMTVGPLDTAVTAAFLGWDRVDGRRVMRLYAGADGKQETAYVVTRKGSQLILTVKAVPKFLEGAEPGAR
ncbi:hypothetical protein [Streptomyces sp. I05A-00742]|uniref:hypothetical protein n=1 Tax=Streptomyces sp. I05A-00742 TaxID=2732853 RepID=UPI001487F8B8|nr:hypothetical protein [Streptomyces sp. I05A-00742]